MRERVTRYWREQGMAEPGEGVLVGVSGGMDSVALLWLLAGLRCELGIRLAAAHFHHGIRVEADGDEALVRALCSQLGVPLTVGRADVPALAAAEGLSLEVASRQARHAFFRRAMAETGCTRLALAHHRDDQAETVLLRLLRGAGAAGLAAMAPVEGNGIVRPLLCVGRAEIAAWCAEQNITWREDATNADQTIPRNWVRHTLLPLLSQRLNPSAAEALCRTADLLRQDDRALEDCAAAALDGLAQGPGEASLPVAALAAQPPAVRGRMLRRMAAAVGLTQDLGQERVAAMESLLAPGKGGRRVELPHGAVALREGERLTLLAALPDTPDIQPVPLHWPGDTPVRGYVLRCTLLPAAPEDLTAGAPDALLLDADRLPAGAVVRSRLPGDRFRPLGAVGRRKWQDVLVDRAVPRRLRPRPFIAVGDEVLAAPGVGLSEALRITQTTTRVLRVECIAMEEADVPND